MVQTTFINSNAFDDEILEHLAKRFNVDKFHWLVKFNYPDEVERRRRATLTLAIKAVKH